MRASACTISRLPAAKPTRQPAIEWLFESERNSIATSLRAGHLEDARRLVAVEADLGVGEVVEHHEVVLLRERDDPLEERAVDHACVVGLCGNEMISIFGFGQVRCDRHLEVRDEVRRRA